MSLLLYRGYFLSFAFMCFNFLNKYLSKKIVGLPPYILVSCRFTVMFILILPFFLSSKSQKIMQTKNMRLQVVRAIISFIVLILSYTGYRYLPLSVAGAISTSEPIFVVLWSFVLRKENLDSAIYLVPMVLLGFLGMFLVHSQNLTQLSLAMPQIIGLVSLVVANIVCSGSHYLLVKLGRTDPNLTTMSYGILFNSAFMLMLTNCSGAFGYSFNINLIQANLVPILCLGVSACVSGWIGLEIFKHIDPNTNSSIQNLSLPLLMIISYFVENETITMLQFIGIIAIFLSTLLLSYRKFNMNKIDTRYEINRQKLIKYIYISYISIILCLGASKFILKRLLPQTHEHDHKCMPQDHDHTLCS